MAKYYTRFSMGLDLTPDESTWCARFLALAAELWHEFGGEGVDEGMEGEIELLVKVVGEHLFDISIRDAALIAFVLTDEAGMFNFQIDGPDLWCYTEGKGSVEALAAFLKDFLERWRPEEGAGFSWADTCDEPRVNAFKGGACWVTVEDAHWMTTKGWLDRTRRLHYDSQKGGSQTLPSN